MKDKIQAVLERELEKLNQRSSASSDPLPSRDVKSLDVLIRAYRAFSDPAKDPAADPEKSGSAPPSTEALVNDILNGEQAD